LISKQWKVALFLAFISQGKPLISMASLVALTFSPLGPPDGSQEMPWLAPPLPPQNRVRPSQTASISAQFFLGYSILKGKTSLVAILMGSRSDWPTLQPALNLLRQAGIPTEVRVVSAHRTPQRLFTYARSAEKRGLRMILAGAGGAAHLPGMVAALTPLPVLGIPVAGKALRGLDSLLSIAQMPAGIPVATFPIGKKGAIAAARFAIALLQNFP
jgi:5-(carboxyamino)imidazole ribonucleotide mutase